MTRIPAFALLLIAGIQTALGQGQFFFTNRDVTAGVNARFRIPCFDPAPWNSSSIGSPDWVVHLLGGPTGGTLIPLDPFETGFRGPPGSAVAGYVVPVTVTVPGVAAGAAADVRVQVLGPGGTLDFTVTIPSLGGGPITPPTIPLGAGILDPIGACPEPATGVSLLLGAAVLAGALLAKKWPPGWQPH